jgi:hypothetical protein
MVMEPENRYNKNMTPEQHTPLKGQALLDMMARDMEARASLACEGIHFTEEEEAVFADMARQGLNDAARMEYLKDYFAQTSPALAAE